MAHRVVDIGAEVTSSDGKRVGTVEHLVLRSSTETVGGFLLAERLIGGNLRMVPADVVASSTVDEVVLSITEEELKKLPNAVQEQLVRAPESLTFPVNAGFVDLRGTGDTWVLRGRDGGELPKTGTMPFAFQAPIGNVEVMNITNLPDDSVAISEGTDVVGSDGKKVGQVDELTVDSDGRIVDFLVKAGWLFKRDVRVPMSLVAGIASDRVRLNVTAEEAENQGR